MRGTSFRHTARRRFSIARACGVRERARALFLLSSEIAKWKSFSCGARGRRDAAATMWRVKTVTFVGHDTLFTYNYGNCERMHWTLAYPREWLKVSANVGLKRNNNAGGYDGPQEHAMEIRETIAESGEFRCRRIAGRSSGEESERIRAPPRNSDGTRSQNK